MIYNGLQISEKWELEAQMFNILVSSVTMTTNVLGLGEGRALKNVSSNIAQKLIEVQMLNYFHQPCFCQTLVSCCPFFRVRYSFHSFTAFL
jgi:hypothetical protein